MMNRYLLKPPAALRKNILFGILKEERRRARNHLFVSGVAMPLSVIALVFSAQYLMQSFYQGSFYEYLSILFTDTDVAFMYWREFALSVVESMPFMEITLSLVAVLSLLASIRVFTGNLRNELMPRLSK